MLPAPIPVDDSERLASLRRMLLLATPDEEAFDRVTRMAKRVFDVPIVLVSLIDETRQWFKSCIGLPVRETGRDVSFCGHAIMSDEIFMIPDATRDERFADNPLVVGPPHVIFYAGRPLKNMEGYRVGTLCLIDQRPRLLSPDELACLNDLGHWVEQVFATRDLSEAQRFMLAELDEVKRYAMLDPMLNIWNRGTEFQLLKKEVDRAFRIRGEVALLMIDVDRFKEINDTYGHPVADQLLIEFVRRIRSLLRSYDELGRYGGDEFLIVMPGITAAEAIRKSDAILHGIQTAPYSVDKETIEMSASIGLATAAYSLATPSAEALLAAADQALLLAKRNGRGRVESICCAADGSKPA